MENLKFVFSNKETTHKLESKKYKFNRFIVDDKNKIDGFKISFNFNDDAGANFKPIFISSLANIKYVDMSRKNATFLLKKDFLNKDDCVISIVPPDGILEYEATIYYENE